MERLIENKTFDEINPGDTASVERTFAANDLRAWSVLLGDGGARAGNGPEQGSAGLTTALLSSLAESHARSGLGYMLDYRRYAASDKAGGNQGNPLGEGETARARHHHA